MRWGLGGGGGGGGGGSGMRSRVGASVSSVDGHVSDGIRPSHCERGDDDT